VAEDVGQAALYDAPQVEAPLVGVGQAQYFVLTTWPARKTRNAQSVMQQIFQGEMAGLAEDVGHGALIDALRMNSSSHG